MHCHSPDIHDKNDVVDECMSWCQGAPERESSLGYRPGDLVRSRFHCLKVAVLFWPRHKAVQADNSEVQRVKSYANVPSNISRASLGFPSIVSAHLMRGVESSSNYFEKRVRCGFVSRPGGILL